MEEKIKIALVQSNIIWEDKAANYLQYEAFFEEADLREQLVVLPEMFATGFSMEAEKNAEPMSGPTIQWMMKVSLNRGIALCGSVIIEEAGNYYNRFVFVEDGKIRGTYDKRHLFRMGEEHLYYKSGSQQLIIEYKGWKILPLVCYDLRFPVWSRNNYREGAYDYDLMIYVANWPMARREAWISLLKARAIENLSFVVGVNRVGKDGRGLDYSGDSMLVDPKGEVLSSIKAGAVSQQTLEISKEELRSFRDKFPAGMDTDLFEIQP